MVLRGPYIIIIEMHDSKKVSVAICLMLNLRLTGLL